MAVVVGRNLTTIDGVDCIRRVEVQVQGQTSLMQQLHNSSQLPIQLANPNQITKLNQLTNPSQPTNPSQLTNPNQLTRPNQLSRPSQLTSPIQLQMHLPSTSQLQIQLPSLLRHLLHQPNPKQMVCLPKNKVVLLHPLPESYVLL